MGEGRCRDGERKREGEMGVTEGRLELSRCLQSYTSSNKSPTPFSPHTYLLRHTHAVTRCKLAVNDLVLDMKVSM